ncbi:hypothetical protein WJX74_006234 [Apatococcus lobatus]|uniref:TPX2 C-terminal domain-containing protein n=1 Tax=Apatococcus lobatus TaxID=904363 RepID=A0AAW1RH76_9CHLO
MDKADRELPKLDPKFEFSAPRYYDFDTLSNSESGRVAPDAWFDTAAAKGLETPAPQTHAKQFLIGLRDPAELMNLEMAQSPSDSYHSDIEMQDGQDTAAAIEVDVDEPARDEVKQARGAVSFGPVLADMAARDLPTTSAADQLRPASAATAALNPDEPAAADHPLIGSPVCMEDAEVVLGGSPMDEGMAHSPHEARKRVRSGSKGGPRRVGPLGIQGQARREPMQPSPLDEAMGEGGEVAKGNSKRPSNLVTSWGSKAQPAGGRPEGAKRKANARNPKRSGQEQRDSNGSKANVRRSSNHSPPTATHALRFANAAAPPSNKTSEQIQFEQARAGAEEAARQRRQNEERLGRVLQHPPSANSRSTKPLTIPVDLHLSTSKRRRLHNMAATPAGQDTGSEAEESHGRENERAGGANRLAFPAGPTHAQAPSFATDGRQRRSQWKSRQQLEEEEMAAMPHFHARPVNPAVMAGPQDYGRRGRAASQPLTTSEAPHLATSDRAAQPHPRQPDQGSINHPFHAQPLNQRILEAPDFEPKRGMLPPTKPHAPQLQTQHRARAQVGKARPLQEANALIQAQQNGQEPFVFKATSTQEQHARPPRAQRRQKGRAASVEPQGFALATEQRGQARAEMEKRQREQQEDAEREAAHFRARPVPASSGMGHLGFLARPASAQPLTIPEPFELASESRHQEAEVLKELQNRQREEERRQKANFKARPVPRAGHFDVHPSNRPLTVPEEPVFSLDTRTAARQQFDAAMAAKQQLLEMEQQEAKARAEAREEAEIREYRRGLEFKARPVPNYNEPFLPELGAAVMTRAVSPELSHRNH